jgi:hypothetical protein
MRLKMHYISWRAQATDPFCIANTAVRIAHGPAPARTQLWEDSMKAMWIAAMTVATLMAGTAVADTGALHGSWKGPWYIGMSSGIVAMDIAVDGSGKITLTNLEEFGSKPVELAKQSFDGKLLTFTATGANGALLTMNLQLGEGGKQLRGNGKHGGFGARMELQRSQ